MPRAAVLCVLAALTLGACTESNTVEPDAEIVFMPPPDAGVDGGPVVTSPIGAPCTSDADCGEGFCVTPEQGFAGGYCTAECPTMIECPAGAACIQAGETPAGPLYNCFDACDPAATERDCRAGYGCAGGLGLPEPVCVPGCTDDTDCPGGACNPDGGGRCYDPTAEWYDACQSSEQCPDGGRCRDEDRGNPGGMCQAFGCDVDTNAGCPGDGQCIPGGRSGFGRCIDGCVSADDCRPAYDCVAPEAYPDRLVCTPACASNADCAITGSCDVSTGQCQG